MPAPRETFRFGDFELDVAAYELRRKKRRVRIERQPMDVLIMLVQRRGVLVSRGEIADALWGKDVFVDVDTGVHTAIRKIRQALHDSAEQPTFVETIPGKGYRFVAGVEVVAAPSDATTQSPHDGGAAVQEGIRTPASWQPAVRIAVAVALLVVVASFGWAWWDRSGSEPAFPLRLAVLPFENLSADPGREYLADGLTEDTIATVGRVDPARLSVLGRTSTMAYKRTTKSLTEIGRELGVHYLVESTIRTEGSKLRVTAKLIRASDQVQIWSAFYDKEPTGMLEVQEELSAAIAEQIHLRLSPPAAAAHRQTRNAAAYDEYLHARFFQNQRNPQSIASAIEHYRRATDIDPTYALAWSELAFTYGGGALNSDADPRQALDSMREAAARAVSEQPNLSEAQFVMGYMKWLFEWDWEAAEAGFRKATTLDPRNAAAYRLLGHALSQTGRHDEAEPVMRRARDLEPLDPINHALSSQVAFQARDFAAAIDHARQAIRVQPAFWISYMQLGQAYEQTGQTDLALEVLADAARMSAGNSKPVALRGYIFAKSGRPAAARGVLRQLEARARERHLPPYNVALVHAGLGDRDGVFEWLNTAVRQRDVHLIFLPVDPKWDEYRTDPRFVAILDRCGFRQAEEARPSKG